MSMLVVMPRVLSEKLGPEGADALADLLAKASVARAECEVCKKDLDSKLTEILQQIGSLRTELTNRIDSIRNELRAEIRAECAKVRVQTFAWTFGLVAALFTALYAVLK